MNTWFVSENGYGVITRLNVPMNSDEVFGFDAQKDWYVNPDCYIRMVELIDDYHDKAKLHIIDPANFENWFYEPSSKQFIHVCPHLFTQHLNHWLGVSPLKIRLMNKKILLIN